MLIDQDIKIPSVGTQTPDIPLNDCGSHYRVGCLARWSFLDLHIPTAFVIGDVTGRNVGPLLSCTFERGVWDAFGMYDEASRRPSILFNRVGGMLACGPAGPPVSVFEAVLALETEGLWASPTGVILCTSHRRGVMDTNFVDTSHRGGVGVLDTNWGVEVGATQHGLF